jgi:hypothetical protein
VVNKFRCSGFQWYNLFSMIWPFTLFGILDFDASTWPQSLECPMVCAVGTNCFEKKSFTKKKKENSAVVLKSRKSICCKFFYSCPFCLCIFLLFVWCLVFRFYFILYIFSVCFSICMFSPCASFYILFCLNPLICLSEPFLNSFEKYTWVQKLLSFLLTLFISLRCNQQYSFW